MFSTWRILGSIDVLGHGVESGVEAEVLLGGQVGVEGRVLEDEADVAPDLVLFGPRVVAGDRCRPGGRVRERAEDLDRRGLAGTVRPEEPEGLAPGHLEVDATYRLDLAVALGEPGDGNHRVGLRGHCASPSLVVVRLKPTARPERRNHA